MVFGLQRAKGVGLIVREISFKGFRPICGHDPPTSRTDGQTTCDRKTALCTVVHRAVKSFSKGKKHGTPKSTAKRIREQQLESSLIKSFSEKNDKFGSVW